MDVLIEPKMGITIEKEGVHVRRTQDLGDLFEENKHSEEQGHNDLSFGRKFASVPFAQLDQWYNEEGLDWRLVGRCPDMTGRFLRKMQDLENRKYRTHTDKLI